MRTCRMTRLGVVVVLGLVWGSPAAVADPLFSPVVTYGAGGYPYSVAIADRYTISEAGAGKVARSGEEPSTPRGSVDVDDAKQVLELFSTSPALFVENRGQWADPSVRLVHSGSGVNVAVTDSGPVFQVFRQEPSSQSADGPEEGHRLRGPRGRLDPEDGKTEMMQFSVSFLGANVVAPVGLEQSEAVFNYCVGEQSNWRSGVPSYAKVAYEGLYEGIDLHAWGLRSRLKYEFHVAPGADWSRIQVRYQGIAGLSLAKDGSLVVDVGEDWGRLIDEAPYIYQEINGKQVEVAGRFVLVDRRTYAFAITGDYGPARPLIIDPDLAWSTYLGGGSTDHGYRIAVDGAGSILVTGETSSSGWVSGGFDTSYNGAWDGFVAKISPSGGHVWSTYLGGSDWDPGLGGITVDGAGNALVAGETRSSGWVSGGFDTSYNGAYDGFVAKISPSGGHVWSTYLGGSNKDGCHGVSVDGAGNVLVTGETSSSGWVSGGFDTSYSTGGDAFAAKLSPSGGHIWSTYLGGSDHDYGQGIAVDDAGNALVAGKTGSSGWVSGGFDTSHNGYYDAFVAKISSGGLNGLVAEINARGQVLGPLAGATVELTGWAPTTTNDQGEFRFGGLEPGTVTITVSKPGYHPVSRTIILEEGETIYEVFHLTAQGGSEPVAFDLASPNGRHLIEGMPGALSFEVTVAWNGSPGSVYYRVAGDWCPATVTDLGGGLAQATLTLAAPSTIGACSELTIEVTNGEGRTTYVNTGVHFSPIPGIVIPWYGDIISWMPSELLLSYSSAASIEGDLGLIDYSVGYDLELEYNLLAATFNGSLDGLGEFSWDWEASEVEILGDGKLDLTGTLAISFAGGNPPEITPFWRLEFEGRAGVGAPVVLIVDIIFPPAAPAVHYLLGVPVVGDVIGALKLRLFLIGGANVSGEYEGGEWGDCFLGTTSLAVTGTLGLEGQAVLELFGAEAGVYAGGTGTPEFQICPEWEFEGITFRAYVGVFASAWLFEFSEEVGAEVRFDAGGRMGVLGVGEVYGREPGGVWRPIGRGPLKWGEANRVMMESWLRESVPPRRRNGTAEETVVENVTELAGPATLAYPSESLILYSLHDPDKPWYAATDMALLRQVDDDPWSLDRATDDEDAEFTPSMITVNSNAVLAAWTRVSGDVSTSGGPEDVAPHLEIVASRFDRSTGAWSAPDQLTSNGVVDRDPLSAVFGVTEGILWVQNEAGTSIGDAEHGDSLMFAEWSGGAWQAPQALWSAPKGIVGVAFAADDVGEGHVVFVVDEDGDLETRTDRELYRASTASGQWQVATGLTSNGVEDALPTLVTPNGVATCVWNSNGVATYTALDTWDPQVVYSEYTMANEAASLDGVTMPSGAAVAYTVQGSSGVDIVAAFYDANLDQWSLPRQLTADEHVESSLSLACDGSELVMAYLKTQTLRNDVDIEIDGVPYHLEDIPQPGRTDLCVLRHELGNDLAVAPNSIELDPLNPAPDASVIISATIESRGDEPVQDVEVVFYDGDPNSNGMPIGDTQIISGTLIAGGTREVTVDWQVPSNATPHQVFVAVDPALLWDDRDRSNNIASMWSVLPEVSIETGWNTEVSSTTVALIARVVNSGVIPTGAFDLSWRFGAVDGEEIGSNGIAVIGVGGAREVTYLWDTQGYCSPGEYVAVFAVADSAGVVLEFDETNNTHTQLVRCPSEPEPNDCNENDIPDTEDLADCDGSPWCSDCNSNGVLDWCDIAVGAREDCNSNGIPDDCEGCPYIYDLDGSCFVDSADLGLFAGCWLLSEGEAGWDENACADKDFNCSGTVDSVDLGLFAGTWLKWYYDIDPADYPECRACEGEVICGPADPVITLPTDAVATIGQNSLISGISVSDADSSALTLNITTSDGLLSFNAAPVCTAVDGAGNPVTAADVLKDEYVLTGTIVNINTTLAGFQFTTDRTAANPGTDQVTFIATDADGGEATGTLDIAVSNQIILTAGSDSGASFTGTADGDVFLDAGPGNFGQGDVLDGGDGRDTIEIRTPAAATYPAADVAAFSAINIEEIWLNQIAAGGAPILDNFVDMPGIDTIVYSPGAANLLTINDAPDNFTLIVDARNAFFAANIDVDIVNPVFGTQAFTLEMQCQSAPGPPLVIAALISGTQGIEILNINSVSQNGTTCTNTITGPSTINVNTVNITGDQDLVAGQWTGALTTTIDASAFTGDLTVTSAIASATITGGSGADTLNGGACCAQSISGGAGADTINPGAAADLVQTGTGADTIVVVTADVAASGGAWVYDRWTDFTTGDGGDVIDWNTALNVDDGAVGPPFAAANYVSAAATDTMITGAAANVVIFEFTGAGLANDIVPGSTTAGVIEGWAAAALATVDHTHANDQFLFVMYDTGAGANLDAAIFSFSGDATLTGMLAAEFQLIAVIEGVALDSVTADNFKVTLQPSAVLVSGSDGSWPVAT